jgi:hypothetical protein
MAWWDYPMAQFPGVQFILHTVSLRAGQPVVTEEPLTLLPTCPPAPPAATPSTPGWVTVCAMACEEPSDTTSTVRAVLGGQRSPESLPADLDLTGTPPCRPVVPPPHPPPRKPPPQTPAYVAPLVAAALLAVGQSATPPGLASLPNLACVSWKITGPCFCSPFHPCVSVSYMEPAYIVEVVKKPGDTVIPLLGDVLQAGLSAAGIPPLGGGGAGNSTGSGQTNLHYSEVHVYGFPQVLGGPCTGCGPSGSLGMHYASEIDSGAWRTATAVPSPLDLLQSVGVWGRLYPRGGKVIHSSEPVAGALAAVRALDIMKQPIGTPPNVDAHIILQPGDGGTPAVCMQLAFPRMTPCIQAGMPPPLWETATLSITGKYVWIIWKQRSCCVNPAQATCGITVPGIGGHGQNLCPLPQLP